MLILRDCVRSRLTSLKSRRVRGDSIQACKIINHIDDVDNILLCLTLIKQEISVDNFFHVFFLLIIASLTLENVHLVTDLHPSGIHFQLM